jgi:hypothetical protein
LIPCEALRRSALRSQALASVRETHIPILKMT